jgi:UDP-glucose-4-epimerase GalE
LVTGGAGYIGSHAVKALTRAGHHPVVYDNLSTGHRESVKSETFIEGDLADLKCLRAAFRTHPIDSVMHFAAHCLVEESVRDPKKYFINNVRHGIQLLEIMDEANVKKIIFSSSASVYGEPKDTPIQEGHPCSPTNPYGETKLIFERILEAFQAQGSVDYISLRYFNAAGADPEGELGEDHAPETHLIPLVLAAALQENSISVFGRDYDTLDGTCVRDYIHVSDLAQAHVLALDHLEQAGLSGVYNLGNGSGYSVRQVIETAEEVTGLKIKAVEAPRRSGDPGRLVASSDKIRRALGWVPRYPDLSTIIETAWKWHRSHPAGYNTQGA